MRFYPGIHYARRTGSEASVAHFVWDRVTITGGLVELLWERMGSHLTVKLSSAKGERRLLKEHSPQH
jgi:hypothetical protein